MSKATIQCSIKKLVTQKGYTDPTRTAEGRVAD